MNKVILLGRLGKNPDVRKMEWGSVAGFSLATDESYKDKDGNKVEKTEWHNVTCRGGLADIAERYLQKGNRVLVEGKIQIREYEKDSAKHRAYEIIAHSIEIVDWPEKSEKPTQPTQLQDDLPF